MHVLGLLFHLNPYFNIRECTYKNVCKKIKIVLNFPEIEIDTKLKKAIGFI